MMTSAADRAFLKNILESRKNLRDRFNFEAADLAPPASTEVITRQRVGAPRRPMTGPDG
jgi:hypothetical protein